MLDALQGQGEKLAHFQAKNVLEGTSSYSSGNLSSKTHPSPIFLSILTQK
jgi:hypothetical protein